MNDLDRLLAAFDSGELVRPDAEAPNLVDLARAINGGTDSAHETHGTGELLADIAKVDQLVFIVVDGLGASMLEQILPENSFLRRNTVGTLRTPFPSTTAVSLTSLATGLWPAQHAVTGWYTHLPDLMSTATILPFIARGDGRPLQEIGVTPETAFPARSRFGHSGRDGLALFPERIADSVYSNYFSGGARRRAFGSFTDAMAIVEERVMRSDGQTITYVYWPDVDSEAHRYGLRGPEVAWTTRSLNGEVERLASRIGDKARIVLTADHGHLEVPVPRRHQMGAGDLGRFLRYPPSGDARVMYLHVRSGLEEEAADVLRAKLGEGFVVLSVDEVDGARLFGPDPMSDETRARIGDIVGISLGSDVVEYVLPGSRPGFSLQASHHSGLTREEMTVPLVVI